jgi:hypothetical protein
MEYRDFQINVTAPLTGVPQWYVDATEGVWTDLTLSHTLEAVKQPTIGSKDNAIAAILPWTGASVDNVRGDLLLVANGGHGDGASNAAYGFRYMANTPGWYCLSEQTPIGSIDATPADATIQQYADGRMRAVHGWNRAVFANGKHWYTAQDSTSNADAFAWGLWSYDTTTAGIPSGPGGSPLPWQNGAKIVAAGETRGPWKYWGQMDSNTTGGGGPACFDPWSDRIWTFHANSGMSFFFSVDPATGTFVKYTPSAPNWTMKSRWVVPTPVGLVTNSGVATEPASRDTVSVLNRTTRVWTSQATNRVQWDVNGIFGTTEGYPCEGWGAVYHPEANAIYAYDVQQLGASVRKLNLSTWQWSTYTPSGTTPVRSAGTAAVSHGSYSKFNIVKVGSPGGVDRYALLNVCHTTKVYAMKLPAGGL